MDDLLEVVVGLVAFLVTDLVGLVTLAATFLVCFLAAFLTD